MDPFDSISQVFSPNFQADDQPTVNTSLPQEISVDNDSPKASTDETSNPDSCQVSLNLLCKPPEQECVSSANIDMSHKDELPDSFAAVPKSIKDEGACFTNREQKTSEYEAKLKTYRPDEAELINSFRPVFIPKDDWGHPHMNGPGRKLPTKHERIVPTRPPAKRRYSRRDEEAIDNFIETSLRSGLISPIDSPTTSALHVVYKNGKPRIVSDLRAINSQNAGDFNYVFPRPTEKIREVTGKGYTIFSSLDMSGAFTQIPVHTESKPLLAFTAMTRKYAGTFAYNFLNFGFKCSPAIFSAELDTVLKDVNTSDIEGTVVNYFDDILVASKDRESHKLLIARLLTRFLQHGVTLNLSKSKFFEESSEFCSYKVTPRGYRFSDKRLNLLATYPDYDVSSPKKNSDLKILGFYNYHRSFVQNYSTYERKIRDTIKAWKLGPKKKEDTLKANKIIKELTDTIKVEVAKTSLESLSDGDTAHLFTDASHKSFGYHLRTDKGVVTYGGGTFTPTVCSSHNIFEKELRALAIALHDLFHIITPAAKLIIHCDNLAAVFSVSAQKTKRPITSRAVKYITNIQTYTSCLDATILHIKTAKNLLSDCLSRMIYDSEGNFDTQETSNLYNNFTNPTYSYGRIKNSDATHQVSTFSIDTDATPASDNILSFLTDVEESELIISPSDQIRNLPPLFSRSHAREIIMENTQFMNSQEEREFLTELHMNTHWSPKKTVDTTKSIGYSVSARVINEIWANCPVCGTHKRLAPASKLNPLSIASPLPLHKIHLDHIDFNSQTSHPDRKAYCITAVCDLTRYLFAQAVTRKNTLPVIDFIEQIQGITMRKIKIISCDNAFQSELLYDYAEKFGIELQFKPSHQPRGVLVERSHETMHQYLAKLNIESSRQWPRYLQKAVKNMNLSVSEAHGFSPSYLFHGFHSDPILGPLLDTHSHYFHLLKLTQAILNEKKQKRASNYKYRKLEVNQRIFIQYDKDKKGHLNRLEATVIRDDGQNASTVLVNMDNRHYSIRIHKSDIFIVKTDPNFRNIFADLAPSLLPDTDAPLMDE